MGGWAGFLGEHLLEAESVVLIGHWQSHTGSVVEQMDTLTVLKDNIEANTLKYGPDLTVSLEKSILSKFLPDQQPSMVRSFVIGCLFCLDDGV